MYLSGVKNWVDPKDIVAAGPAPFRAFFLPLGPRKFPAFATVSGVNGLPAVAEIFKELKFQSTRRPFTVAYAVLPFEFMMVRDGFRLQQFMVDLKSLAETIYKEAVIFMGEHCRHHGEVPYVSLMVPDFSVYPVEHRNKQTAERQLNRAEHRVRQLIELVVEKKLPRLSVIALSDLYPRPYQLFDSTDGEEAKRVLGARKACFGRPLGFCPIKNCVVAYVWAKSLAIWHQWNDVNLPSMDTLYYRDYHISLTDVWEARAIGSHEAFDPRISRFNKIKKSNYSGGRRKNDKRRYREKRAIRRNRALLLQAPSLSSSPERPVPLKVSVPNRSSPEPRSPGLRRAVDRPPQVIERSPSPFSRDPTTTTSLRRSIPNRRSPSPVHRRVPVARPTSRPTPPEAFLPFMRDPRPFFSSPAQPVRTFTSLVDPSYGDNNDRLSIIAEEDELLALDTEDDDKFSITSEEERRLLELD